MKQTTKMSRAVSQLEHIYNALNTDFFQNELPIPIITVQSKPGTYGHCTTSKVWQRKDGGAYELNIAAEVLNYPIEETLDTMLHEMVHLYCRENGIKEVSREGNTTTRDSRPRLSGGGLSVSPVDNTDGIPPQAISSLNMHFQKAGMKSKLGVAVYPPSFAQGPAVQPKPERKRPAAESDPAAQESCNVRNVVAA